MVYLAISHGIRKPFAQVERLCQQHEERYVVTLSWHVPQLRFEDAQLLLSASIDRESLPTKGCCPYVNMAGVRPSDSGVSFTTLMAVDKACHAAHLAHPCVFGCILVEQFHGLIYVKNSSHNRKLLWDSTPDICSLIPSWLKSNTFTIVNVFHSLDVKIDPSQQMICGSPG